MEIQRILSLWEQVNQKSKQDIQNGHGLGLVF